MCGGYGASSSGRARRASQRTGGNSGTETFCLHAPDAVASLGVAFVPSDVRIVAWPGRVVPTRAVEGLQQPHDARSAEALASVDMVVRVARGLVRIRVGDSDLFDPAVVLCLASARC